MQYGPRIVWGSGCPETDSGAHVVEFNETGTAATCCQCALVIEGVDRHRAFLALPVETQREMIGRCGASSPGPDTYEDLWGRDV